MNKVYEKLISCEKQIREKTDFVPEIALVLGSGLGGFSECVKVVATVDYKDIDGTPTAMDMSRRTTLTIRGIGNRL